MAQGDRIETSNIVSGAFFEQPGTALTEVADGWDVGTKSWLTSASTRRDDRDFPKIGDAYSSSYPFMRITDVDDSKEECGLKMIVANYRGAISSNGGVIAKPGFTVPGVSTQMVTIPVLTGGGSSQKKSLIVPVPMPTLTRRYVSADPILASAPFVFVGNPVTADFLPPPGSWSVSYLPDPDQPLPVNYYLGWVLMSRTVEAAVNGINNVVWLVTEEYQYFWGFAA